MIKGIDVSGYQGNIDWKKVKAAGIKFAIIKFGNIYDTDTNDIDSKFEINYKNAKANGLKVGIFFYNYCNEMSNLKKGLEWFFEKIKDKKLDLPIYIDMEDKSIAVETVETLTNQCNEFAKIAKQKG